MDLSREKPTKRIIDLRKKKSTVPTSVDDGALSEMIRQEMKQSMPHKQMVNRAMKTNPVKTKKK